MWKVVVFGVFNSNWKMVEVGFFGNGICAILYFGSVDGNYETKFEAVFAFSNTPVGGIGNVH